MRRYNSRRRPMSVPEITLTPLIDTALTLLIIFMVTTPMIHNAIKVNLPRGRVKEDIGATQDLVVSIGLDQDKKSRTLGQVIMCINGTSVTGKTLIPELRRMVGRERDKLVYVNADKDVKYGFVTEIVDQMKCVEGIAHVALATQKA
jgi:biopolymer transport protein ExbD